MNNDRRFSLRVGAVLIFLVCSAALISLFYTPCDPYAIDAAQRFLPPSLHHWFGTDNFGRDNFSRAVTGARYSLFVASVTVALSCFFGVVLGLLSGFAGGIADEIILRLTDALSSFPAVLTALVAVTVFSGGKFAIIPALAIAFLPSFIRLTRSGAMRLKNLDYIQAAYVSGASTARIMFRHLLPNLLPTLIPAVVVGLSNAILAESGMSYLGLGIQPPTPSWGRMLFEGQTYLFHAPWETLSAGLMMVLTVLGFHALGESLEK
ncbi:putative D,D-dipeptide transport system permease protein DdpC [Caprobacter fermentans]|uniref:Putative D,D-dipeptide transport system permease protein DdpC n=1 Tax=Caproicibacter fermentans TaxID=2576756 RepID=A0A6N8I2M6_9FIRM|nr:ABC transporter permease [Caproicibacter fermentans]MVB12188.1 putative D,D-dipeptide transport system permease protein DdpC [Caproicibacter fermentans]